ncbi:hypothetical protein [Pedobacter hiemivivus]|uniref:Uncharacterized protein n=1 Tax=Pedobacter hiemivivus TaxID=2530454 RepID=A0A4R0M9Q8_9SPHI|nr:hypothetical protein [Pedobacter hiemivivus]TCC82693.1 hypothetical protein EZ444_26475 [Pedobacter hiemivivus]
MKSIVVIVFLLVSFRSSGQKNATLTRSASMAEGVRNIQSTYYVQSKGNISKVENSDASRVKVKEWRVRLYKKGAPRTGNSNWGSISASSAEEVMKKLKAEQEFELRSNAFFGKGRVQDEICTHFNPLGPIAVLDEDTEKVAAEKRAAELYAKSVDIYETFLEVKDNVDALRGVDNPYSGVGNNFKEYAETVKDVTIQTRMIQKMFTEFTDKTMNNIYQKMKVFDSKMDGVQRTGQQLKQSTQKLRENNSSKSPIDPSLNISGTNEEKIAKLTNMLVDLTNELASASQRENVAAINATTNKMIFVLRALVKLYALDPDTKEMSVVLQQQLNALEEASKQ